jgi:hypothetical protein
MKLRHLDAKLLTEHNDITPEDSNLEFYDLQHPKGINKL